MTTRHHAGRPTVRSSPYPSNSFADPSVDGLMIYMDVVPRGPTQTRTRVRPADNKSSRSSRFSLIAGRDELVRAEQNRRRFISIKAIIKTFIFTCCFNFGFGFVFTGLVNIRCLRVHDGAWTGKHVTIMFFFAISALVHHHAMPPVLRSLVIAH